MDHLSQARDLNAELDQALAVGDQVAVSRYTAALAELAQPWAGHRDHPLRQAA